MYTFVGDTLYGGNAEGPWMLRVAPGQAPDTVHLAMTPRPMTDEIIESYKQAYRDAYSRMPERFEGAPDDLFDGEYAATVPAYSSVHHDDAGNLWLGQWKLPFSSDPWTFHVYTTRGRPAARIELPGSAWVAFLASDRVGLIETDEMGVQYVRVYDILKPAEDGA
jgi:hypothetical protein